MSADVNASANIPVNDIVLTKATVLSLTETWNAPQPSIDGYRVIVCSDDAERPSGGVAIYVRHPLTAVDLKLPLTSQSHNGEHAAITLHTGTDIVIMTMYLAPNLSRANVEKYIDKAMVTYDKTYKETVPFILAGDFNVDLMKKDWIMQYMASRYSLRCISYDHKQPTTIRGTCIDLVFSNFKMEPLLQHPLTLHFTDHKAVILKAKRQPQLDVTYIA